MEQKPNDKADQDAFDSIDEVLQWIRNNTARTLPEGFTGRLQLVLRGDEEERIGIQVSQAQIEVLREDLQDPDVVFSLSKTDFLEWNNGLMNPMRLMMEQRLDIEGSVILATKFQLLFGPEE